jgi:hypothetical protein
VPTTPEALPATRARVAAFARDLERLSLADLVQTVVSPTPSAAREAARLEAERIAREHGLDAILADARSAVREYVLRVYDEGLYRPTMVGLNWGLSAGTSRDRVAAVRATEDAMTAAVIEPFAPDELVAELAGPFEVISRGHPVDDVLTLPAGAASALGSIDRGGLVVAATVLALAAAGIAFVTGLWPLIVVALMAALLLSRRRARP